MPCVTRYSGQARTTQVLQQCGLPTARWQTILFAVDVAYWAFRVSRSSLLSRSHETRHRELGLNSRHSRRAEQRIKIQTSHTGGQTREALLKDTPVAKPSSCDNCVSHPRDFCHMGRVVCVLRPSFRGRGLPYPRQDTLPKRTRVQASGGQPQYKPRAIFGQRSGIADIAASAGKLLTHGVAPIQSPSGINPCPAVQISILSAFKGSGLHGQGDLALHTCLLRLAPAANASCLLKRLCTVGACDASRDQLLSQVASAYASKLQTIRGRS